VIDLSVEAAVARGKAFRSMGFAPKVRFAPDSSLEGTGFELLVPREKRYRDLTNPGPSCDESSKPTREAKII
jgi:hypothetical protein